MKQRIRVAMIIQAYHPRVGGAERQLAALAPILRHQGVEVSVLTRRYPGLRAFERIDDVPVYRLPIPGPTSLGSLVFTITALPLLLRLRPDVLHAHELLSPTTTAIAAKRLLKIPVVAKVLRGGIDGDLAKLQRNRLSMRRVPIIRKEVNAFAVISREIDAELAAIGVPVERRHFIPNGVDLTRFRPPTPQERTVLRAHLGLPEGLIAIYTGRLVPEKRVADLVGLWPIVRASYPSANLLIIGGGPDEAELRRLAGMGVHFVGIIADVADYLRAADLFILPSATEGLSNALLEAMAVGLPVVATAVGGAPDVIADGESGYLVPPNDVAALQSAVLRLMDDGELRTRFGQRGHELAVSGYTLPETARRLRTLYEQLTTQDAL